MSDFNKNDDHINNEIDSKGKKVGVRKDGTRPLLPTALSGCLLTGILIVVFVVFMLLIYFRNNHQEVKHPTEANVPVAQSSQTTQNPSIIAGRLEPSIETVSEPNGNVKFIYKVKNQTEEKQELKFKNDLKFDYILKDSNGNILEQRSKQVKAGTLSVTQVLGQGEELNFEITRLTGEQMKKGSYMLEVWLVLEEGNKYIAKKSFTRVEMSSVK